MSARNVIHHGVCLLILPYVGVEREDEYVQIALQRIGLGARLAEGPAG